MFIAVRVTFDKVKEMADAALLRLWASVCQDFERARAQLPPSPIEIEGCVARLEEWLGHNELELALGELEAIGEDNNMPPAYWRELLSAATSMGLSEHLIRLRKISG